MPRPRTPLLRPNRYFADHGGSPPLAHAAVAVLIVAVGTAAGAALIIDQLVAALDVTVTVDNPQYPGEPFCGGNSGYEETSSGCNQPETVERNLGALVAEEFAWVPILSLVVVPLWWLFQATVLHLASALADGEGAFDNTLVVAGWGMVPSLLRMGAVVAFLGISAQSLTVPANPEGAIDALRTLTASLQPVSLGFALLAALWAGVIRSYGLAEARDLHVSTAGLLVGTLTVIGLLFELG